MDANLASPVHGPLGARVGPAQTLPRLRRAAGESMGWLHAARPAGALTCRHGLDTGR